MKASLDKIIGYDDAIIALYESKRHITEEMVKSIRLETNANTLLDGSILVKNGYDFLDKLNKVLQYGKKHTTLLRFIDLSITVFGLHRGAMDDLDSHAKRMENRIVRSSTRLADYGNEKSSYYSDKILTIDDITGLMLPNEFKLFGIDYVRATNGYIRKDLKDNKDVLRGLLPLSIPMNCIFKINLAEFAHIYKLRNKDSNAHPELKQCIEEITDQLLEKVNYSGILIDREYLLNIEGV